MKLKLNKSNIDKIKYSKEKPVFYYDTDLIGFGIKASATRIVYFVEDQINGRTVRKNIAQVGTLTPDEARKQAKVLLGEMAKGVDIVAVARKDKIKSVTLGQAYEDFKKYRNLRESTITGYNTAMNTVFKDWLNKPLSAITGEMVVRRFKQKSAENPYGANLYFRCLRAVVNFAMENYSVNDVPLLPYNPCNKINKLKIWNRAERRTRYIKPDELMDFINGLKILPTDRLQKQLTKKQCMVILFTSCRDQEIASLQRKNIDFKTGCITIETTKNHHRHILPYGKWLGEYLAELCCGLAPDDYLFPANNKSGHLKDHRKACKEVAADCKIEFSLHDLRRTFASIANNYITGMTQYTLKKLLNHAEDDVTAGYIQFDPEQLRKPMQAIEDFILIKAGIKEAETNNDVKEN